MNAPISIEQYHRMIDAGVFEAGKFELLNGLLVEKLSKSPLHQFVVDLLVTRLREFSDGNSVWVRQEGPVTIGASEPEPDVSVIEGSRSQFKRVNPTTARFVIEVAISSLPLDRAKAVDYASAGIPEYWIVRPEDGLTEVYRDPREGVYTATTIIPAETPVESNAIPGFRFNLAEALQG